MRKESSEATAVRFMISQKLMMLLKVSLVFCLLAVKAQAANEAPQTFTLDGTLFQTGTSIPLLDHAAKMTVQVIDPAGNCLLYEEQQTVNTFGSGGNFHIYVGSPTGSAKRTVNDPGRTMAQIFQNTFAISANNVPGHTCAGTVYSPSPGAVRYFRITITPSGTNVADVLSPDIVMDSVPSAVVAQSVQGLERANILQTNTTAPVALSQANLEALFTTPAYANLQAILAGNFIKTDTSGAPLPSYAANPASPSNGEIWFDSTTGEVKYKNASGIQTVGAAGGGTISSLTVGSSMSLNGSVAGTISSGAGTIDLTNTGIAAGTYAKLTVDAKGRATAGTVSLVEADIPNLTVAGKVSGNTITSGTISGSAAINTTGNLVTTGTISGMNVQATNLRIYNGANYIQMSAPALSGNVNLTLPVDDGNAGEVLSTDGNGILSWISSMTTSLASGKIWVGNGSNVATAVALSGDASLANTGVLTLANTGVGAGTYTKVTVDTKGRVTSAANITSSDVTTALGYTPLNAASATLAGDVSGSFGSTSVDKIKGKAITAGSVSGQVMIYDGTQWVNSVVSGDASLAYDGTLNLNTVSVAKGGTGATSFAANRIIASNGTGSALQAFTCALGQVISFDASGNAVCGSTTSGTVTSVTSSNAYLTVATGTSTPVLTVNVGTAANTVAAGDDSRITGAAQKSANLSDLASASTARNNLGLGTAAVFSVGTSANNVVQLDGAGKLPAVDGSQLTNVSVSANSISGVVAVANGGTNSSTALNNNRMIVSNGGKIVEAGAMTDGQIIVGATGGAPAVATVGASNGISITAGAGSLSIATNATSNNTASTIVSRNASGDFSAGNITSASHILQGSTSGAITMTVPATVTPYTLTWPAAVGGAGNFLTTDASGNLSWGSPAAIADSSYTVKGAVQFNTDAATSGITVASGVATVNAGVGANQIVKLDASSKLPAVDGSALTNLTATNISGNIPIAKGGTGQSTKTAGFDALSPTTTKGDLITSNGTNNIRVPAGTDGYVLQADSSQASGLKWSATTNGTVTSVSSANSDISVATGVSTPVLTLNSGVGANQIVKLDSSAKLPAVDGSALTNLTATNISGAVPVSKGGTNSTSFGNNHIIASNGTGTALVDFTCALNQVISFDASGNATCANVSGGTVTSVTSSNAYLTVATGTSTPVLTVNVGAVANTVAAGDDSRITGAAQKSANLSDLASAATARTNLGLGTAAVFSVGTSANNVVQLDGTGKLPAVDGSQLTNVTASGISGVLPVANGGTNSSTALNNNRVMVSNAGKIVEAGAMTDGQILVGATGAAPSAATIGASNGISITASAGAISIATNATNANTASTIVSRDASGNFAAGAITNNSNILKGATSGAITMTVPATVTSYTLTWPSAVGGAGNFLTTDASGNLSWGSPAAIADSSYSVKGAVQFNTDAATSGITVASGVATVNAGVGANQIVKLDASSKLPAVDGSALTNLTATNISGNIPISKGGTGQSTKTAGFDALSPTTTKGDLITNNGTNNIRLPAGTDGYVLQADSSQASGLKWAAASNGTVTSVSSANSDISVATGVSTPVLTLNSGTGANQIVKLDGSAKLPAVDGSALTNLTATNISGAVPVSKGGTNTTSFGNNHIIASNGTGSALVDFTCSLNQVIAFDASGNATCASVAAISGAILNGGNTTGADISIGTNDNKAMTFKVNNTTALTISQSGKVIISTGSATAPYGVLHVTPPASYAADVRFEKNSGAFGGDLQLNDQQTGANKAYRIFFQTGGTLRSQIQGGQDANSNAFLSLGSATNTGVFVNSSGNVGIAGNISPSSALDISGALTAEGMSSAPSVSGSNTGRIYYDYSSNKFKISQNGAAYVDLVGAGSITSVGGQTGAAQSLAISVDNSVATPTITSASDTHTWKIPMASNAGTTAGLLSKTDYDNFNTKLGTTTSFAGDVSGAYNATIVQKIQGKAVTAASVSGQIMIYNGTSWVNSVVSGAGTLDYAGNLSLNTVPVSKGGTNATSFGANRVIASNGTGSALTDITCSLNQVLSFDASGYVVCANVNSLSGAIINGGNTTGADISIGTNDNKAFAFKTNNTTAMTISQSGYVGIGTTNPGYGLHVKQDTILFTTSGGTPYMYGAGSGRLNIGGNSSPNSTLSVDGNSSIGNGFLGTAAPTNGLIVQGNVGLGTTAPTSALTISGAMTAQGMSSAPSVSGSNTGRIYFDYSTNKFKVSENGGAYANLVSSSAGFTNGGNAFGASATLGTTDNNSLSIITNNATAMTISQGGNVGIGTTAPSAKLHVVGANNGSGNAPMAMTVLGGTGTSGNGGGISLTGGNDSTGALGAALAISGGLWGGPGGDGSVRAGNGANGYNGGAVTIAGGTGTGAGTGGSIVAGGGLYNSSNGIGGDVTILGGAKTGTGTNGNVLLATTRGYVGVGTTAPSSALDVSGALTAEGMSSAPSVSTSGTGRIYFDYSANKFKVSQNGGAYTDLVSTSGTISIGQGGTNATSFAANGVIVSNGTGTALTALNCSSGQVITFDASGYAICGAGSSGFANGGNAFGSNATLGTTDNKSLSIITNNTTAMTVSQNGWIGIGTTAPNSKFHIYDSQNGVNFTAMAISMNSTGAASSTYGYGALDIDNTIGGNPYMNRFGVRAYATQYGLIGKTVGSASSNLYSIGGWIGLKPSGVSAETNGTTTGVAIQALSSSITSSNLVEFNHTLSAFTGNGLYMNLGYGNGGTFTGNFIKLANNNVDKFAVTSTGNVGVGTAAPSTALDVSGAITAEGMSSAPSVSSGGTGRIYYDYSANKFKVSQNGGAYVDLVSAGSTAFVNGGNAFGANTSLGNTDNYPLNIITNNTTALIISQDGSVGIGSTPPASVFLNILNPGAAGTSTNIRIQKNSAYNGGGTMFNDVSTGANKGYTLTFATGGSTRASITGGQDASSNAYLALSSTAEAIRINSSQQVGIGTPSPSYGLHVKENTFYFETSGGSPYMYAAGSGNLTIGSNSSAANKLDVGGAAAIGYVGSAAPTNGLIVAGNVGIGAASAAARLDVTDAGTTTSAIIVPRAGNFTGTTANGMIRYNTTSNLFEFYQNGGWVNYTTVSDGRLKTNVEPVTNGLSIVNQLNPVFYDWDKTNPRTQSFRDQHEVGFIAQEVEKVLPEVVDQGKDSYRSIQYGKIVSVVVAAVKELYNKIVGHDEQLATQARQIASKADKTETDAKIQSLESENAQLKTKNQELEQRLEKIEKALNSK